MKDELFNELVASVREGEKILRGKAKASRTFVVAIPSKARRRCSCRLQQNTPK